MYSEYILGNYALLMGKPANFSETIRSVQSTALKYRGGIATFAGNEKLKPFSFLSC